MAKFNPNDTIGVYRIVRHLAAPPLYRPTHTLEAPSDTRRRNP